MTPSYLSSAYNPNTLWVAWCLPYLLEGTCENRQTCAR